MAVANPASRVARRTAEREKGTQIRLDLQWESRPDRGQVMGGLLRAVGSLGHLGYLTSAPMKRDRSQIQKKIEKKESFKQILRESMISRYWNWNMKMRRSVVLTSLE